MSHHYQFLVSYTLSHAKDENYVNSSAEKYGYYQVTRYGTADRRHRLVVSGVFQLPAASQLSAIADFRSALPFGPSSGLDLNNDGYTGDLPVGVAPGSGCRSLDLGAVNSFRTAPRADRGDDGGLSRASPTSTSGSRSSSGSRARTSWSSSPSSSTSPIEPTSPPRARA